MDLPVQGSQELGVFQVHVYGAAVHGAVPGADDPHHLEEVVAQGAVGGLEEDHELVSDPDPELPRHRRAQDDLPGRRVGRRLLGQPATGLEPVGDGRSPGFEDRVHADDLGHLGLLLMADEAEEPNPR